MLFSRRKRRGGIGLSGILVIGGLLYGTGAGGAILESMKGIPQACSAELGAANPALARAVCGVAGQMVSAVTSAGTMVGGKLDDVFGNLMGNVTDGIGSQMGGGSSIGGQGFDLSSLTGGFDLASLGALVSSDDALAGMLHQGPSGMSGGGNPSDQLQAALDSLSIGQRFLSPDSGNYQPNTGINWLQQGASQNEYGLLPQLSLGSLYMQGGQGIPADPQAAVQYYSQALQSLQTLQGSNRPGAQQMLATLPVSPAQLQKELIGIIRAVKPK